MAHIKALVSVSVSNQQNIELSESINKHLISFPNYTCNQATAHQHIRQSSVGGLFASCLVIHSLNTTRKQDIFHSKNGLTFQLQRPHVDCNGVVNGPN